MRSCFKFIFGAALIAGCHQPMEESGPRVRLDEDGTDQTPAPSRGDENDLDLVTHAIDVTGDVFGVGIVQLPDMGNDASDLTWYGNGCSNEHGWTGSGCWSAQPFYMNGVFTGMGAFLPEDGIFRGGCAKTADEGQVAPDGDWCRHLDGVDEPAEDKWILEFEECGVHVANICIKRVEGVSYPAEAECFAMYNDEPVDCQ